MLKKIFLLTVIKTILFIVGSAELSANPIQFGEAFFIAEPVSGIQRYPVAAYAKNVYLVTWQEGHYGWRQPADTRIMGIRISVNNNAIDKKGFIISDAPDFQENPVIATDGEIFFVVWQDFRNGEDYDIYATRVTSEGRVLDIDGIPVVKAKGNQCKPSVAFDGKNFVIAWMDNRDIEQSYSIYAGRVNRKGVVIDPEGVVIAGHHKGRIMELLHSDNLAGIPLNSFPKISCMPEKCLVGWIQKTEPWKEAPRFLYVSTEPEIKAMSKVMSIYKTDVLKDDRGGSPLVSIARNADKYMAVYSGIQGKGGGHYFVVGLYFGRSDELQNAIEPVKIRPWETGYKISEYIASFDVGFVIIWTEGVYPEKRSLIKFVMKAVIVDAANDIRIIEIIPPNDSYIGYPFIATHTQHGLLVYEKIDKDYGMRIVGIIFNKK